MSELSSLHDQNTDFCQNFCQARKQMQPPVTDQDIDLAFRAQLVRGSGHFKSKAKRDGECCNSRYNQSNVQSEKQRIVLKLIFVITFGAILFLDILFLSSLFLKMKIDIHV